MNASPLVFAHSLNSATSLNSGSCGSGVGARSCLICGGVGRDFTEISPSSFLAAVTASMIHADRSTFWKASIRFWSSRITVTMSLMLSTARAQLPALRSFWMSSQMPSINASPVCGGLEKVFVLGSGAAVCRPRDSARFTDGVLPAITCW